MQEAFGKGKCSLGFKKALSQQKVIFFFWLSLFFDFFFYINFQKKNQNLAITMIYVWQFGYLLCFDLGILVKFLSPSLYALPLEFLCIYLSFFSLFKVYLRLWALFLCFFNFFFLIERVDMWVLMIRSVDTENFRC